MYFMLEAHLKWSEGCVLFSHVSCSEIFLIFLSLLLYVCSDFFLLSLPFSLWAFLVTWSVGELCCFVPHPRLGLLFGASLPSHWSQQCFSLRLICDWTRPLGPVSDQ